MRLPKLIDNKRSTVIDELRNELSRDSKLSIISAYFTIYAYAALKKELDQIDEMRFIFTEPTFVNKEKELIREYFIERNNANKLLGNEYEIKLRNEMKQAAIARECANWLKEKTEIKSFKRPNPAQPRLIYIENEEEHIAIHGTVDFTSDGLGVTPSNRVDTNTCMYGRGFTQYYLQNFDQLWQDENAVQDVKAKVLEQMMVLYKENTPEFIYFVTLYNIFRNYLDELTEDNIVKSRTGFKETQIWNKLYRFQKDGVMGAIDKIEKYNGCIIADSVGLGKTFTALAVIKYYELRNDRVLVLVPKRLRENWTIYTLNDKRNIFIEDRFNYDVLNHTDLSRISGFSGIVNLATVNWSNYDLVVVDESHNFRNNPSVKDRVTRYQRFMNEIIKAGVKTKVLMLSATPVNNRMNDIKNQIAFITEGRDNAFQDIGLDSLEYTLRKAQAVFNRWTELPEEVRTSETFVNMMDLDYFKLLDTVTIARSRKHIKKYYNLQEIGKFPTRLLPKNKYPKIDLCGKFPPIEDINLHIKRLSLCIYSPISYVLPAKRKLYEDKYDMMVGTHSSIFRQTDRENSIVNLMRIGLLKRMESSIKAFAITVSNILDKVETALKAIDEKGYNYDPSIDIDTIDIDDPEFENLVFGSKVKVLLQDMDLIKWRQDLLEDRDKLETILLEAMEVTPDRDAKLLELKELIDYKIENPINSGNNKVLIFTAFADTARYLYENLAEHCAANGAHTAIVTGTGDNRSTIRIPSHLRSKIRMSDINTVLTLFSPISKECSKVYPEIEEYIDILIATDCISEGQNLQDSQVLNPV